MPHYYCNYCTHDNKCETLTDVFELCDKPCKSHDVIAVINKKWRGLRYRVYVCKLHLLDILDEGYNGVYVLERKGKE